MSNVCKNLNLSIHLEPDPQGFGKRIRLTLEDPLAMLQTEHRYELDLLSPYHLQEAIIIAMRRLVNQAITDGLIQLPHLPSCPGALMKPNTQRHPETALGIEADITLSTDEELL